MAKTKDLTPKQQRVIDCFDGDYITTAKNAGVTHGYVKRLCTHIDYKHIQEAIKRRNRKKSSKLGRIIASREERQAFWTRVFIGEEAQEVVDGFGDDGSPIIIKIAPKMTDRLKASELLGRSEADFTDKIQGEINVKHDLSNRLQKALENKRKDRRELNRDIKMINQESPKLVVNERN